MEELSRSRRIGRKITDAQNEAGAGKWACGFTAGCPQRMLEQCCAVVDAIFWDLSHTPEDCGEENFGFDYVAERKWDRVPVKIGTPAPQKCQLFKRSGTFLFDRISALSRTAQRYDKRFPP